MSKKYSPFNNAFYDTEINSVIPDDSVDITDQQHIDLLVGQSSGKVIYAQADNTPGLKDFVPPAPTWDEIRVQRDNLLSACDWTDLPNTPLTNKQAWLDYRQALRNIPQTYSDPSEVVWPTKP